jgi:RHS repeat-associated protein
VAPTIGLATRTNALASVSGTTLTWKQAGRAGYDSYGRVTTAYDALDHPTTTSYTPTTGGPVTGMTMTNSANHVVTTTLDGIRGLPLTVVDPNNKTTTLQYDPLGRLLKVFKPHTIGPTTSLPDVEYTYTLRNNGPNVVSTKALGPNGTQIESFELYDGRLRLRQTQVPSDVAHGGRVIADTTYDSRGLTAKTSAFWNSAAPSGTALAAFADVDVQNQHRYTYDGVGRQTADGLYAGNVLKWQVTTGYDGDRTWVIPPAGGIATMVVSNASGKMTELRQYLSGSPPGGSLFQATTYGYDRLDRLTTLTDAAGNQWTTGYDLRGRTTSTTDPDKGATELTYDDAGQLTKTVDARGVSLSYSYDNLGRKTGMYDGATTSGFKRAGWVYDTIAKGQLTSSSRYYNSTDTYTTTVTGYNDQYQPLGVSVGIPLVPGQPTGTYTVTTAYNIDGSVASTTYPAAGGLAAETVTNTYDNTGHPLTVAGQDPYVSGTVYREWGPMYQRLLGTGTKKVRLTTTVEEATSRLLGNTAETQNQTMTTAWDERLTETYGYDNAGNVKSIKETSGTTVVSNQCVNYDALRQLAEAWTTTASTCQTTPSLAILGGPDSYWTSYTYNNPTGNRTSETKHRVSGPDIARSYTYPTNPTGGQKHTLDTVTTSGGATGTDTYSYDSSGNTTSRNVTGKPGQTLTWDNEGHLATVTDSEGTTSYIYDASGTRLVSKEPTGVTVYLPGFELRTAAGTTTCTRYYAGVASRTTGGPLTWLASDHHGTTQLAIDATTLAVTRRKTDPFGNPRGADPAWPNTRGFVNGTRDHTGLTHLGAREYEPNTGRFVSVDPVMDVSDPQQMNGYSYAGNSPITSSDPSGLCRNCFDDEWMGSPAHRNAHRDTGRNARNSAAKAKTFSNGSPYTWQYGGGNGITAEANEDGLVVNGFYMPYIPGAPTDLKQFTYTINEVAGRDDIDIRTQEGLFRVLLIACEVNPEPCTTMFFNYVSWAAQNVAHGRDPYDFEEFYDNFGLALGGTMQGAFERRAGSSGTCRGNSFSPETRVLIGDGISKAIKDVSAGDTVIATDTEKGETASRTVLAVIIENDTNLTDVTIADSNGNTSIVHTTPMHPFWDESSQAWVYASGLDIGHRLRTHDGRIVRVVAIRSFVGASRMYNLTVDRTHTYYVLAGDAPVLAHNDKTPWDESGHSNYVLIDKATNKVYYSGRFGPNETAESVVDRHTRNGDRFRPGKDRIEVIPGTRTYGEARVMEDDLAAMYGTYIGKGKGVRGNVIRPMDVNKREGYYNYASSC